MIGRDRRPLSMTSSSCPGPALTSLPWNRRAHAPVWAWLVLLLLSFVVAHGLPTSGWSRDRILSTEDSLRDIVKAIGHHPRPRPDPTSPSPSRAGRTVVVVDFQPHRRHRTVPDPWNYSLSSSAVLPHHTPPRSPRAPAHTASTSGTHQPPLVGGDDDDDDADAYDGDVRLRCGTDDGRRQVLLSNGRPQPYILGPSKWNKTQLTYRIRNFPASLGYDEVRLALTSAFQVWSDVTLLTFDEVQTGHSDISVEFSSGHHLDGYPFDGPGNVVAHAFFPGEEQGGDVHFDADESWTVNAIDGVNLFMVAAHEIGHALGLSHSKEPGSLMSPWHHGYYVDFTLPDDDMLAIQELYGVLPESRRRLYKAPTAAPTPRPTPDISDTEDDNSVPPLDDDPAVPDPCETNLDAISLIRGEVFAFKGKWFWRINVNEKGQLEASRPTQLTYFWFGLPAELEYVDAVFERPSDGRIFFFSGNRYWEFRGNTVDTEMSTTAGRPLTDLGLPSIVDHLDAAFVWGYNQRTYLVSGRHYWKLDEEGETVLQYGYPRDMSTWTGVRLPVDAAFTHTDGRTYFFKGSEFWEFNNIRMQIRHPQPRHVGHRWLGCPLVPSPRTTSGRLYRFDVISGSSSSVSLPPPIVVCFIQLLLLASVLLNLNMLLN